MSSLSQDLFDLFGTKESPAVSRADGAGLFLPRLLHVLRGEASFGSARASCSHGDSALCLRRRMWQGFLREVRTQLPPEVVVPGVSALSALAYEKGFGYGESQEESFRSFPLIYNRQDTKWRGGVWPHRKSRRNGFDASVMASK